MARLRKSEFDINDSITGPPFNLPPLAEHMDRLDVWQIPSMDAATNAIPQRLLYWPERIHAKRDSVASIRDRALHGDKERLDVAVADSDSLITDAIIADPRLARRSQW